MAWVRMSGGKKGIPQSVFRLSDIKTTPQGGGTLTYSFTINDDSDFVAVKTYLCNAGARGAFPNNSIVIKVNNNTVTTSIGTLYNYPSNQSVCECIISKFTIAGIKKGDVISISRYAKSIYDTYQCAITAEVTGYKM